MHFSVEQIRSLRGNYLEAPYPGFSLDEVCRRRRMAQTKLVRGENAWCAKGTAQTTEEWARRLAQGTLNKISEESFDTLVETLKVRELFSTDEVRSILAGVIFQKVLGEPESSKLYAQVCCSLAVFEVGLPTENGQQRRDSELRSTLVHMAQAEFNALTYVESEEAKKLCAEDREFLRANFMRRKKANIRFVGELFLKSAVSQKTISEILSAIVAATTNKGFSGETNIEILKELLETIGKSLEKQNKKGMDGYFATLSGLLSKPPRPYPPRIRYMIMDLLELRKANWLPKPKTVKSGAVKKGPPTVVASSAAAKNSKLDEGRGAWHSSPSKREHGDSKPPVKGGKQHPVAGPSGVAAPPASSLASRTEETAAVAPAPAPRLVKFEQRVHSMFQEWVAELTNDFIPEWMNQFNDCDRTFARDDLLCVAVAMEVIREACTTTRKDAQREAVSFLIVGLFLEDDEMFRGFAGALTAAIDDGLLEDVPKFQDRFISMVRLSSNPNVVSEDVYYDTANVLCMAYNQLASPDEFTVETLISFWNKVPRPDPNAEEDDQVTLNFAVLYTLCENANAKPGLEKLIAAIIDSLHQMGIVDEEAIATLVTTPVEGNELFTKVVEAYKLLQSVN